MGLRDILIGFAEVVKNDLTTKPSFKTGQKFEDYVLEHLFPRNYYDLVEKTHNYQTNKHQFVESSLKPDFKFRDRLTKKEFYVEAKFRTNIYQGKIVWCNETQLVRYQRINRDTPVFLILGDGGEADLPDNLSLIPISKAKYTGLFLSYIDQFQVDYEKPITSNMLWNR